MSKTLSYKHPVLGNADDFLADWGIECYEETWEDSNGEQYLLINVECIKTEVEEIDHLLQLSKLSLFVEVTCLETCYRKHFLINHDKDQGNIQIPRRQLAGAIKLQLTMEANSAIEGYKPTHISSLYPLGQVYEITKGDVLAVETKTLSLNTDFVERTFESVSWIRYRHDKEHEGAPSVDHLRDDVLITISTEQWNFMNSARNSKLNNTVICLIVAPVLVQCIERARDDNDSDSKGWDWIDSLMLQMEQLEISDDEHSASAAWKLLQNSLYSSFKEIKLLDEVRGEDE